MRKSRMIGLGLLLGLLLLGIGIYYLRLSNSTKTTPPMLAQEPPVQEIPEGNPPPIPQRPSISKRPEETVPDVSEQEVDQLLDEMIAALDQGASSEESSDEETQGGEWEEDDVSSEESPSFKEPEGVARQFLQALRNSVDDPDSLVSLMQGRALERVKIYENLARLSPERKELVRSLMAEARITDLRYEGPNEFRFRVIVPLADDRPEFILHPDETGRWWIDDFVDLRNSYQ